MQNETMLSEFAADVLEGLTASPKFLSSKYFYNKEGDAIFQEIMVMPEYYLTRSEYEIFSNSKAEMLDYFSQGKEKFHLIEFGSGDGLKTKVLLKHFWEQKANFCYLPIDISPNIIEKLTTDLQATMPGIEMKGVSDDYFNTLEHLDKYVPNESDARKVIFFLGANIGNYTREASIDFLMRVRQYLLPGDQLMIGMDLRKDPSVIHQAYCDKGGITQAFNLNLLKRINTELGADFDISKFQFYPIYNPQEGSIKSYLVSKQKQEVNIKALEKTILFEAWEAIFTERSHKFLLSEIEELAEETGFRVVHNFYDCRHYFTDSLWTLA